MRLGIGLGLTSGASPVEAPALDLSAPVAQSVPLWSDTAPAAGDTVTITKGTYVGIPIPDIAGTLTLDGADVTAGMAGDSYTIPGEMADAAVLLWSETASNAAGSAAAQTTTATVTDTAPPAFNTITVEAPDTTGNLPVRITNLSEPCTVFFVTVPATAPVPTVSEVITGAASGGGAPADSGTFDATPAGGPYVEDMAEGLNGIYDLHFVLRDAANNTSAVQTVAGVMLDTTNAASLAFGDAIAGGDDPVTSSDFRYARETEALYGVSFVASGDEQSIDTLAGLIPTMTQGTRDALNAAGTFVAIYDSTTTGANTSVEANIAGQTTGIQVTRNSGNGAVSVDVDADTGGALDVSALYGQSAGTVWRLYVVWTQTAASRVYHNFNRFNQAGDRYRRCTIFERTQFDADDATMETEIAGMAI